MSEPSPESPEQIKTPDGILEKFNIPKEDIFISESGITKNLLTQVLAKAVKYPFCCTISLNNTV